MEKPFKQDKRVFLFLVALVSISFLIAIFGESIAQRWRLANYKHPSEVGGVRLGDQRKDLIAIFGKDGLHASRLHMRLDGFGVLFHPSNGKVYSINVGDPWQNLGFTNDTAILNEKNIEAEFGSPDIYSASEIEKKASYTYSNDGLKTGVEYGYIGGTLSYVAISEIFWNRVYPPEIYMVNEKIYCPGRDCPWSEEVHGGTKLYMIKPDWQDKTVRDLVEAYK